MPSTHIDKIITLLNKGYFIVAEKQIKHLIKVNPKNYAYQNLLSIAYAKQNKTDLSIKILQDIQKLELEIILFSKEKLFLKVIWEYKYC